MINELDTSPFFPVAVDRDSIKERPPPAEIRPFGDLIADLASVITEFIDMHEEQVLLIEAFIFATWFPDCFEAVPYLWIVGALGSAKTTLLKLLSCLCRHAVLVGDVHASAIYELANHPDPSTPLIDELDLDSSKSKSEVLRLLRTGTTGDIPAVRHGRLVSTYGFKAVSSRETPADGALASRVITISMLPTERDLPPLDRAAMRRLQDEFQPRLQSFRLAMRTTIEEFQRRPWDLPDLTPRMRQIARVLASAFAGDPERRASLVTLLRERDEANRLDRLLETEWLVVEALFAICHPRPNTPPQTSITVGFQGEEGRLSARKVGSVLRSLRLNTKRLGNLGRGFKFTRADLRQIHEIARRLGIDRTLLTNECALEAGNGGVECGLCEEYGVTDGLRFTPYEKAYPLRFRAKSRLLNHSDLPDSYVSRTNEGG
jgi:hypothetical protein